MGETTAHRALVELIDRALNGEVWAAKALLAALDKEEA